MRQHGKKVVVDLCLETSVRYEQNTLGSTDAVASLRQAITI